MAMNIFMSKIDAIKDQEFFLFLFLIIFIFKILFDARDTKKIIERITESNIKQKELREKLLEFTADTREIFEYFLETKQKLPENLHNIMLAHCLNKDYYANSYINSIDVKTGKANLENENNIS
jgi:hypothetical protein